MNPDPLVVLALIAAGVTVVLWLTRRRPPDGPPVCLFSDNYLIPG